MQFTNSRQAAAVSPVRCGAGLGKQKCLFLRGKIRMSAVSAPGAGNLAKTVPFGEGRTQRIWACQLKLEENGPEWHVEFLSSSPVTHMKPRTSGSQSTSAGKKTMATRPRPMNKSSQMTQRTVDSMDAPVSRQLTMRLTAMGGQNCPRAMT